MRGDFRKTPDGILKPSGVCQLDISVWMLWDIISM